MKKKNAQAQSTNKANKYGFIGYAYGEGGLVSGAKRGPLAYRQSDVIKRLSKLVGSIEDFGDVSPDSKCNNELNFSKEELSCINTENTFSACKNLHDGVSNILQKGFTPIIVGGDHSLSIGSCSAIANHYRKNNEKVGLLWIDTHPDVNTPASSPSKRIFGMSTAFLLGEIPGQFSSLQNSGPAISTNMLSYIGLREVDPGERDLIKSKSISNYSIKEIDIHGIANVVKSALADISPNGEKFIVSFDLDVCDPKIVPGTGTPSRGGLSFRESHLILELLAETGNIAGIELVELNPLLDKNSETTDFAISLLESAVGKTII